MRTKFKLLSRGNGIGATSKPILFSGPMVRAILDGTKTQTRRIVKEPFQSWMQSATNPEWFNSVLTQCPYGQIGTKLWVRETFGWTQSLMVPESEPYVVYRATFPTERHSEIKWKPSIFMPHGESRIELTITKIRAERLNNISVEDSLAEGIEHHSMNDPRIEYQWLWEKINGRDSWALNPFVWVIEFSRNKRMVL